VAGIAGASLTFTSAACYVKGQGVRAPRTGAALIFPRQNSIIDRVTDPAKIPSSIASSIPSPTFRSPNLRADFFIGVGVRALIALACGVCVVARF
jgi:hypothetical protein